MYLGIDSMILFVTHIILILFSILIGSSKSWIRVLIIGIIVGHVIFGMGYSFELMKESGVFKSNSDIFFHIKFFPLYLIIFSFYFARKRKKEKNKPSPAS